MKETIEKALEAAQENTLIHTPEEWEPKTRTSVHVVFELDTPKGQREELILALELWKRGVARVLPDRLLEKHIHRVSKGPGEGRRVSWETLLGGEIERRERMFLGDWVFDEGFK